MNLEILASRDEPQQLMKIPDKIIKNKINQYDLFKFLIDNETLDEW